MTRVEDVFVKFNGTIEGKVLVVCNEMQSMENARYINADAMKSIITEKTMMYEQKYISSRLGENVSNLMFLSNHELPIKIDDADRRYVCLKVSSKYRQDFNYFGQPAQVIEDPEFIKHLYTFFLYGDI